MAERQAMNLTAITAAISITVSGLAVWNIQSWRYQSQIATLKTEYATAQFNALEKAHAETLRLAEQAQQAQKDATVRIQRINAERNKLAASIDGLRSSSTEALLLSGYSHAACIDRATALKDVFDQCSGAYGGLAEKADKHTSDVQTLTESWPK